MTEQFGVCAYGKTEWQTLQTYLQLKELGEQNLEVWEIERDRHGNFFVIITRHQKRHRGRKPKLPTLKRRVDADNPVVYFGDYKGEAPQP